MRSEEEIRIKQFPPNRQMPVSRLTGLLSLAGVELRPDKLGVGVLHVITGLRSIVPSELVDPDLTVSFPLEKYPAGFRVFQG